MEVKEQGSSVLFDESLDQSGEGWTLHHCKRNCLRLSRRRVWRRINTPAILLAGWLICSRVLQKKLGREICVVMICTGSRFRLILTAEHAAEAQNTQPGTENSISHPR